MEFVQGVDLWQMSYVAVFTFGAVSAVNILWRKLESNQNLILSFIFAFIFGFVPADFGNFILNRVRDAVAIAVSLNGAYQFLSGIALKMAGLKQIEGDK